VQTEGKAPEVWIEVEDFSGSRASDKHFTLDGVSGELRLGPAVKQQEGTIRLYGDIPPKGSNLIFERYRYGGGQAGNVQEGVLNTLKTSIPYVDRVMNRTRASDGRDPETLESAKQRAPEVLHSRDRAITEADFEFLARQAIPARRIGRVKCLQALGSDKATPGQVYVVVIPRLAQPENRLDPKELELRPEDVATLRAYLDERRLLTTRLEITKPAYRWVAVRVKLQAVSDSVKPRVEAEVLRRLYAYLNPLTGGPNQDGWPFGRDLFLPDLYPCLQGLPDVLFVDSVEMYLAKEGGEAQGNPLPRIDLVRHGMIASGRHQVEFLSG
jgi:predicted phage baseplate assembly protein